MPKQVQAPLVDTLASAFREYLANGGDKSFVAWHDSEAPAHPFCNFCLGPGKAA